MLAKKSEAAPASVAKAAPKAPLSHLRIGEENDRFEQEADRLADQVMSGFSGNIGWIPANIANVPPLQRECVCGGGESECEKCKEKKKLQRKASGSGCSGYAPATVGEVVRSPGKPLEASTSNFFSRRLGYDFSAVRVHDDAMAAESATAMEAQAYTVGNHMVFRRGKYRPENGEGKRLLAHELVHTIQQQAVRPSAVRQMGGTETLQSRVGTLAQPRLQCDLSKYAGLSIKQLRKLAVTDKEAAEALTLRYRAMSDAELANYTRSGGSGENDGAAESELASRKIIPKETKSQGRFSDSSVQNSLEEDIAQQRAQLEASGITRRAPSAVVPGGHTEGGTIGSARTNIPGLENKSFTGRSPQAGGQVNPNSKFAPPTDPELLPQTHGHAEQDIADQLEEALKSIPREQLKGRRVWMLIEQEPCSTCAQGEVGVLAKLSRTFAEVTFEVKNLNTSALMVLENGVRKTAAADAAVPKDGATGNDTSARVETEVEVIKSTPQPDGSTVAEVEYEFTEGLEGLNKGTGAGGQVPSHMVVRVTQNAEGAITAVESVSGESQAFAEALTRQTLRPRFGAAAGGGTAEGVAAGSRNMTRLATGLKYGGWAVFALVTGYQLYKATPKQRPRVLAQAEGGLVGGTLGSYVVCNLVLDIETVGAGLFICGFVAGGVAGYAGSEVAGHVYDQATRTELDAAIQELKNRSQNVQNFFNLVAGNIGDAESEIDASFVRDFIKILPVNLQEYEVVILAGQLAPVLQAAAHPQLKAPAMAHSHAGPAPAPVGGLPSEREQLGEVCPNCHKGRGEGRGAGPSQIPGETRPTVGTSILNALRRAVTQLPRFQRAPGDITHHLPPGAPFVPPAHHPGASTEIPSVAEQIGTVCPNCRQEPGQGSNTSHMAGQRTLTDADRQAILNYLGPGAAAGRNDASHSTPLGVPAPSPAPQGFPSVQEQQGASCPSGNCHQPARHDALGLSPTTPKKGDDWYLDPSKWK